MLNNIAELNDLGELPNFEVVDGGGRVELMIEHNAKCQTSCENRINKQKVGRARVKHRFIPIV